MSILHFSGLNELHPVSKAVKGRQTWMLKTGPSADKLEEYRSEGDAIKANQIVMRFGRQPQWVVLNFAKEVSDLQSGEFEIKFKIDDAPIEENTVVVAGIIDGSISHQFLGSLMFTRKAGSDFDIWFECQSKRIGFDWVFKVGEFKYRGEV